MPSLQFCSCSHSHSTTIVEDLTSFHMASSMRHISHQLMVSRIRSRYLGRHDSLPTSVDWTIRREKINPHSSSAKVCPERSDEQCFVLAYMRDRSWAAESDCILAHLAVATSSHLLRKVRVQGILHFQQTWSSATYHFRSNRSWRSLLTSLPWIASCFFHLITYSNILSSSIWSAIMKMTDKVPLTHSRVGFC